MGDRNGLYIVGIISIVAFVAVIMIIYREHTALAQGPDLSGQAIQVASDRYHPLPECEDSDGGENYYERGIVTYTHGSLSATPYEKSMIFDHCSGDNVNEVSCFRGADGILTFGWTSRTCTDGCYDGACMRPVDQ